jgi:hypothetical protein
LVEVDGRHVADGENGKPSWPERLARDNAARECMSDAGSWRQSWRISGGPTVTFGLAGGTRRPKALWVLKVATWCVAVD